MGTVLDRCKEFPVFVREGTCAVQDDKDQFRVFQNGAAAFYTNLLHIVFCIPQTCRIGQY